MTTETAGDRLYQIRAACGGGMRDPMPMKAFVARVKKRTGATYHANTISLLERNEQGWRLTDVITLSAVDPDQRGAVWLSCLSLVDEQRIAAEPPSPKTGPVLKAKPVDPRMVQPAPMPSERKRGAK